MGVLGFPVFGLVGSLFVLLVVCYFSNLLFATLFDAVTTPETSSITALILFFILPPPFTGWHELAWIALAGLVAQGSKYLIAARRKHLFNPAAFAAAVFGLTALYPAAWWVGTPVLLPFTLILGLLVVRKIRRFRLVGAFLIASLTVMVIVGATRHANPVTTLVTAFTSWPLVFFGTIMLTEPYTMPPRSRDQLIYGLLTGGLFASQSHIGPIFSTPEVVLLVGNLFAYVVSPKYRLRLRLKEQRQLSARVSEFVFIPDRPVSYRPGQYMDFTLPHAKSDLRGNRRTFSLASSPTEPELRLGIKFYEPSSTFKTALRQLQPGATLIAGQLAGNFLLPSNPAEKLLFIAGGIGITPFRSMLKYLVDTGQRRDIILFYGLSDPAELCYQDVWVAAQAVGARVIPILGPAAPPPTWTGRTGFLDAAILTADAPDFRDRRVYISGPNVMVDTYRDLLIDLGVSRAHIVTDYFSGY
jgi:ferredoxin-NADP reductase